MKDILEIISDTDNSPADIGFTISKKSSKSTESELPEQLGLDDTLQDARVNGLIAVPGHAAHYGQILLKVLGGSLRYVDLSDPEIASRIKLQYRGGTVADANVENARDIVLESEIMAVENEDAPSQWPALAPGEDASMRMP